MSRYHNNLCHIRCLVTLNCNAKLIISYIYKELLLLRMILHYAHFFFTIDLGLNLARHARKIKGRPIWTNEFRASDETFVPKLRSSIRIKQKSRFSVFKCLRFEYTIKKKKKKACGNFAFMIAKDKKTPG